MSDLTKLKTVFILLIALGSAISWAGPHVGGGTQFNATTAADRYRFEPGKEEFQKCFDLSSDSARQIVEKLTAGINNQCDPHHWTKIGRVHRSKIEIFNSMERIENNRPDLMEIYTCTIIVTGYCQ